MVILAAPASRSRAAVANLVVASWAHDGQHLAGRLGSSAEVTSSNSIALGCMARPRPMATLLLLAGGPLGVMAGALCEVDGDHVAALGVERRDDPGDGHLVQLDGLDAKPVGNGSVYVVVGPRNLAGLGIAVDVGHLVGRADPQVTHGPHPSERVSGPRAPG